MAESFAASVGRWASKTPERIAAVRGRAIDLLADEMALTVRDGGRVPFQTGNLARSILASTQGMPNTAEGPFSGSNVGLVTATLGAMQPMWIGYTANYAKRQNFGFVGADSLGRVYNQAGAYFVENAIAKWPEFVKQAAKELQTAVESR